MSQPVSLNNATPGATVNALQGTKPIGLDQLAAPATAPVQRFFNLTAEQKQALVAEAFVGQAAANPKLLDFTPGEAEKRFENVPRGALQNAVDQLAKQYGISTKDDDGNELTLGKILEQLPQAAGKKLVVDWFKGLKEGQQALVVAIAAAAYIGTQGVEGLSKLGLNLDVVKGRDGKLNVALVPADAATGRGLAGQLSGSGTLQLGSHASLTAEGSINTAGSAMLKTALGLVFGDRKLDLGVAKSTDTGETFSIGYAGRNATLAIQSANGQVGATASYKITPQVTLDAGLNVADPAPFPADASQPTNFIRATWNAEF